MKFWPFKKRQKKHRVLVFPKGTVVKYDGIPCELLQDTPYESRHIRNASGESTTRFSHVAERLTNGMLRRAKSEAHRRCESKEGGE